MSSTNPLAAARAGIPGLPDGAELASYATYLEAQRAVDHLSDEGFAVQQVSIIGSDLRSVERVTGRLDYPRAALAGALSGAWMGAFFGLLLSFTSIKGTPWIAAILIGAGFGMLFGVVRHAATRGRRDFSSVTAVIATRYTVVCAPEGVGQARELLSRLDGVRPLPPEHASPPLSPGPYG